MNALSPTLHARATRMPAATFAVWRVTSGLSQPHPTNAETLADIEAAIATEAYHGDTFLILETANIGAGAQLHTVRVRKGSHAVGWNNGRKVYAYTADRICSVAVASFHPVEPWRHSRGCDVLGVTGIIEGKRA